MAETILPRGVDVSGTHQGVIDWARVARSGVAFAYAKASQGRSFKDRLRRENLAGARANGVLVGAYHFYEWAADPDAQARNFLEAAGGIPAGDLPPAVDFELPTDGAGPFVDTVPVALDKMARYIDQVEEATGRQVVIYTYSWAWRSLLENTSRFSDRPLWLADYTPPLGPFPGGWENALIWQTSATGRVDGISGVVDLDAFNGSLQELRAFAQGPQGHSIYFPETGHSIHFGFKDLWERLGGLGTCGYPLTDELREDGLTVQYFENCKMEWKPNDAAYPRLGAVGRAYLELRASHEAILTGRA